jgi:hypothetical protein
VAAEIGDWAAEHILNVDEAKDGIYGDRMAPVTGSFAIDLDGVQPYKG